MTFDPTALARPWLIGSQAYKSERDVYGQDSLILLDANENPYGGNGVNRYPGPEVAKLYARMAAHYSVNQDQLLITPGSDQAIDFLIRGFCAPGEQEILINPPTFGMYALTAQVNGVATVSVPMADDCKINWPALSKACQSPKARLIFLCSPQNPLGTPIPLNQMLAFARSVPNQLVVIDEAYQEFCDQPSALTALNETPNLIVMRTLSKAFGLAGARVGCMMADPRIIAICRAMMGPYALSSLSAKAALAAMKPAGIAQSAAQIAEAKTERQRVQAALKTHPDVIKILPSAANFLFVIMRNAEALQKSLVTEKRILLRNMGKAVPNGLRIGIGTPEENDLLLQALGLARPQAQARKAELKRDTKETSIYIAVNLDDPKAGALDTGVGFFDHMLEQLTKHSGIGMTIQAKGDTHIDTHHTVEDTMIALGHCLDQAVGDKRGIQRYGHFDLVMDEARAQVSLDLSGRAYCVFDGSFTTETLGELQTQMIEHCFVSLAEQLRATIHVTVTGDNDHHKCEAAFKALAKALKVAVNKQGDELMTTKGVI